MSATFVGFHNSSSKPNESKCFYEELLGWAPSDGPGERGPAGEFSVVRDRGGAQIALWQRA